MYYFVVACMISHNTDILIVLFGDGFPRFHRQDYYEVYDTLL